MFILPAWRSVDQRWSKAGRQAGLNGHSLIGPAIERAMPWRKTLPEQLSLDDSGLNGTVALRMGWHLNHSN